MAVLTMPHRIKVMHIITHLDLGGAESIAMQLVSGLADDVQSAIVAVMRARVPTTIGNRMAAQADVFDVPIFYGTRGRFKSGGVFVAAWRLAAAVRRFRPDVLHVHTEIPELTLAVACLFSRRVRRTPLLRTVHNSVLWIAWGAIGRWVTRRLAHGVAVAVSAAAADADAAIATGQTRPRADVLYNGVVAPPLVAEEPAERPLRVLFAGRLVYQKGADLLPAIVAQAGKLAARRDVEVIVAGDGAMRSDLIAAFDAMPGPWRVTMAEGINDLARHLDDYDCLLLPARFEGLGILQLEAMMAGLPLITCRAPGLSEVLPPDYPLATAPGDVLGLATALARVVDDPALYRARVRAYGAPLRERFAPARMLEAYLLNYRELAATGGRA